jgi:hypothetical protein
MEKDYEIECALDTLVKAKEIEADKELMKKVQDLAKSKANKILSIADLKKKYQEVAKEEEEYEDEEEESKEKEIKIVIQQKDSLMTEEDKVVLQDKKELEKKNKGKLGDLKYNG